MTINRVVTAVGAISMLLPGSAQAASFLFNGSIRNVTPPGVSGGRCGPAPALTLSFSPTSQSASGQSNLGSFTYEASHCVTPTPPVTNYGDGLFKFTFEDGAALEGTYTGTLTFGPSVRTVQDYVVTGGAGRFAGATGAFRHDGSFVFGPGGVTTGQAAFSGSISAVPEPATWAMMIGGLGAVGWSMRRAARRDRLSRPDPAARSAAR